MNPLKTSVLKTVLEYLGRGATPVDGFAWVEPPAPSAARQVTPDPKPATGPSHALFHVRLN